MKKLIIPVFSLLFLAACGSNETKETESTETENGTTLPGNTGVQNPAGNIPDSSNSLQQDPVKDSTDYPDSTK